MSSWAVALASDLEPTAINLHDRQRGPGCHRGCKRLVLKLLDLLIPVGLQLVTDLVSDAAQLSTADLHFGKFFEDLGGVLE